MRRITGLALLLCSFALVTPGCANLGWFKRAEGPCAVASGPPIGKPAPEIDGVDFEGRQFKLSAYRGNVVVVSFWRSGCVPCRQMIPHERSLVERFRDKKFALLGVNLDDSREAALKVMASDGIIWRNSQASPENLQPWKITALPTICVIDAKGIVRHTFVGAACLDTVIEVLLAEVETKR